MWPSLSFVFYASWQLDFTMEILLSQGTLYIWKEQNAFCRGNTEGWSVTVIVEKEIVQQEISDMQVKNCGCSLGLSAPPPPSPRLLNRTQQWPAGHPSHHSKYRSAAHPSPLQPGAVPA